MANPVEKDQVLAEYAAVRKYRVRLLETSRGKVLDVREHLETGQFSGYTRRGVRFFFPADVQALAKTLAEVLAQQQSAPTSAVK